MSRKKRSGRSWRPVSEKAVEKPAEAIAPIEAPVLSKELVREGVTRITKLVATDTTRWREAHRRLKHYVAAYHLMDSVHEAELVREIFEAAIERHLKNPKEHPTVSTMKQARQTIGEWLKSAMGKEKANVPAVQQVPIAHLTLLLSQVPRKMPMAFLAPEMPDRLRLFFARSLMMTGPTLNVASMTPRDLDYGPMLQLAQQTWHQWNTKRFMEALVFWACIYSIFYTLGYYILRLPAYNHL